MNNPKLEPRELAEVEKAREDQRVKQPYASELDDRELEHAHSDKRPVNPKGEATAPSVKPR